MSAAASPRHGGLLERGERRPSTSTELSRVEPVSVTEILIHWHAGLPQSQIAISLGLDRTTVTKYVDPAIGAGVKPDWPPQLHAH